MRDLPYSTILQPNIVQYMAHDEDDASVCESSQTLFCRCILILSPVIVMELVSGGDLLDKIKEVPNGGGLGEHTCR